MFSAFGLLFQFVEKDVAHKEQILQVSACIVVDRIFYCIVTMLEHVECWILISVSEKHLEIICLKYFLKIFYSHIWMNQVQMSNINQWRKCWIMKEAAILKLMINTLQTAVVPFYACTGKPFSLNFHEKNFVLFSKPHKFFFKER